MTPSKQISHVVLVTDSDSDADVVKALARDESDELVLVCMCPARTLQLTARARTGRLKRRTRVVWPNPLLVGPIPRPGQFLNLAVRCCSNSVVCVSGLDRILRTDELCRMAELAEPLGSGGTLVSDLRAEIDGRYVKITLNDTSPIGGLCCAPMSTFQRLQMFDEYEMNPRLAVPSLVARAKFVPYKEGLRVKHHGKPDEEVPTGSLHVKHSRVNRGRDLLEDLPSAFLRVLDAHPPVAGRTTITLLEVGNLCSK